MWGRPCRASIEELPRGVDLVVFVVPARVVVGMVDACATRGVRGIMVVSSGFAEAGPEGRALQDELRVAALRSRIPVLGPNVEGFVNYVDHVAPYGTTPPPEPVEGSISVISQSGTVAWSMIQQASDRGVGLRIVLGVGNEAVLGLGDLFTWAAADPATEVVTSLRGDDARRGGDRRRAPGAPRGTEAGRDLRARGEERSSAPRDRGAHRRVGRGHRAARCLAPGSRRGAGGRSGHPVRGRALALARAAGSGGPAWPPRCSRAAPARCSRRRREPRVSSCPSSRLGRSARSDGCCRTTPRRTTPSTSRARPRWRPRCSKTR